MPCLPEIGDAARTAVEDRLNALDEFILGDGEPPAGMPDDCCGECRSCEAGIVVAAVWPVFLAAVVAELRASGELDAATAATYLERDLDPAAG